MSRNKKAKLFARLKDKYLAVERLNTTKKQSRGGKRIKYLLDGRARKRKTNIKRCGEELCGAM